MKTLAEALQLYSAERYADAVRRLALVTQFDPDNVQAWLYYGAALGKLKQWPEAVEAYRQVVRLQPELAGAWCDLAGAQWEAGQPEQAEQSLRGALALEPGYPPAVALRRKLHSAAADAADAADHPAGPADRRAVYLPGGAAAGRARRSWLPVMLPVLGLLLIVSLVVLLRRPGAAWRNVAEAVRLTQEADEARARLAHLPGEDFDITERVEALMDRATTLVRGINGRGDGWPETHWVLAQAAWYNRRDALEALNHLSAARALVDRLPDHEPRRSGLTTTELEAALLRLTAEIEIERAVGEEAREHLNRARQALDRAHEMDPQPADQRLEAALQAAHRRTTG